MLTRNEFLDKFNLKTQDIIAIDGKCGSGKTTLANILSHKFDIDIIHLDDFFVPFDIRTDERMSECGGNVHYERFIDEVINGIKSKKPFSYKKFDCRKMGYTYKITLDNNRPIIIEGSYSLREDFREIYTYKIFMDIEEDMQKERIVNRVGLEKYNDFKNIWIPCENKYFKKFNIKNISDVIIM